MYRTGDRARWREDGTLLFLGRNDDQIKIRGNRIELGEIEARLIDHPAVGQAAVVVDGERLVGYVVAKSGSVDEAELRDHAARTLPEAMIPTSLVALDAPLPMTPNGKLDRAALPKPPDRAGPSGDARPTTPEQQAIAALFADALKLPEVGIHDDFFALGGHSLMAIRIVSRLRTELHADVALRDLYTAPTLAGLADRLVGAITVPGANGSLESRQLRYWRETLRGLPERPVLAADRPRPPRSSGEMASVDVDVAPALAATVDTLTRRTATTTSMVLEAALAALLTSRSGGTDIPLGTRVAGNTIVLRTDTGGDPSLLELLLRVREIDLAAFERADLPFDRLLEALGRPHPLFGVMVTRHEPELPAADLRLVLDEPTTDRPVPCHIEYATDLFDAATVRRLAGDLLALITSAVADPLRPLSQIAPPPAGR